MENLRLFLGISLSTEAMRWLSARSDLLARRFPYRSWTHPEDYHLTLHFLGEMPASRLDAIGGAAAAVATASTRPPKLALDEPGAFGDPDAPRILWCGIREPDASPPSASPLAALQKALGDRLAERAGFEPESRPYRPHVTLARRALAGADHREQAVRDAWREIAPATGGGEPGETPVWTADGISLYRTHLGRRPAYERMALFPFA